MIVKPGYNQRVLSLLVFAAVLTISTSFDGGSAGSVQHVSDSHVRIGVRGDKDQNGRNRQASWYHFEVKGAQPGKPVVIDMIDLPGEYNFQPNRGAITGATPPVVSYDGRNWTHIETVDYNEDEPYLRLNIVPKSSRFRIAHTPPYTGEHLAPLRKTVLAQGGKEEIVGKTPEGRPMLLWTIGSGSKTAWLMFRQHAWESGTSWVGDAAVRELLRDARSITWKIFPMADPDGVASGRVRFNAKGFDLNRNWDTIDPDSLPEITAQHAAIEKWLKGGRSIDFFFTLHNTETAEYLQGPPGEMPMVGKRLFDLLVRNTSFSPSRSLFSSEDTTTAGMKGRMTVVQGLHHDFKIPAFLMEQRVARHTKLGRFPTVSDRIDFGKALVTAIAEAICCDQ